MEAVLGLFKLAANGCGTKTGLWPSLYDGPNQGTPLCDAAGHIHITSLQDVLIIFANAVRILIAFAGGLAVIMIIVAGIYYIVSAGDSARVKSAKDMIVNTALGLLIIVSAYAVVTFIAVGF